MMKAPADKTPGATYLFVWRGHAILLTLGVDGYWRDQTGVIYGFFDPKSSTDEKIRCGVGVVSLPENHPLNRACRAHDAMYSIPVWQAYHTREEADKDLKRQLEAAAKTPIQKLLIKPFYCLARVFGRFFWENKTTNT